MLSIFHQNHHTHRAEAIAERDLLDMVVRHLDEAFIVTFSLPPTIYTTQGVLAPGQAAFTVKAHFSIEPRLGGGLPGTAAEDIEGAAE